MEHLISQPGGMIWLSCYNNMYTFVVDGEHTAVPECNLPRPVRVLSECQHLSTLPVQSTLFCALSLSYSYPLPLLLQQTLTRKPYYQQLQAVATGRQL